MSSATTPSSHSPASRPRAGPGHTGRIDAALIAEAADPVGNVFICGSNGFVESASTLALEAGYETRSVKTERFGPTG